MNAYKSLPKQLCSMSEIGLKGVFVILVFTNFLNRYFHGELLTPSLFETWKPALRFEISDEEATMADIDAMQEAVERSVTLFDEVFYEEDNLLVVADVYTTKDHLFLKKRPLTTYRTFVKEQDVLNQLRHELIPEGISEEGEEMVTHRFLQPGCKMDIQYELLMEHVCYESVRIPLTGLREQPNATFEIYFLNLDRGMVYHLYNERGCDILASDKNDLRFLYEKYTHWICEKERSKMDALFDETIA